MTDRTLAVYERVLARAPLEGRDETKRLTDAATRRSSASSTARREARATSAPSA